MARGAAKQRRPAAKPVAPRRAPQARRTGMGAVEQSMFFPRLRRQAKWAFALMVAVFALSFVFLGVGSGSSGIGDLLQGHLGQLFGGSSGSSISSLQDKVKKDPKNAGAWRQLGNQLQAKNRLAEAAVAFQHYVKLRPKSADVLETLGALQMRRASGFYTAQQNAYLAEQESNPSATFAPSPTSKIGQALGTDPIANALSTQSNGALTRASKGLTSSLAGAVDAYKQLVALHPKDADARASLAYAAENAGDTKLAIASYSKFLKLNPTSPDAKTIRQRIKALKAEAKLSQAVPKASGGR